MLPAEKMELAIFKCVERSGPVYDTNIPTLGSIVGINTPHHLIKERLKDLHGQHRILLSKISGNVRVPFGQRFIESEGENAFWGGGFIVEIAPQGRKYFEELVERERREAEVSASPVAATPQVSQIPRGKIPAVATINEIIAGIDALRTELATIRRASSTNDTLRDAKLQTFTKRTYVQLKDWGFVSEAEQGFGRNSAINLYLAINARIDERDARLHALRDDMAAHPEHYESRLANGDKSESITPKRSHANSTKVFQSSHVFEGRVALGCGGVGDGATGWATFD
jgi:hypothetical protein